MHKQIKVAGLLALLVLSAMVVGCTKPYTVTTALEQALPTEQMVYVGAITDDLPYSVKERPTLEDIDKFRVTIAKELKARKVFVGDSAMAPYEVRGTLADYEKGSGALRFMFGIWAGGAHMSTHLELVESGTGRVLFAGDFTGTVNSWLESGNAMFKRIAADFAKQLAKQTEKLRKSESGS